MRLVTYQPFRALQHEINRMFEEAVDHRKSEPSHDWTPSVDIMEENEAFVIHAELPGIEPEKVRLHMENNALTLSGEKVQTEKSEDRTYHRFERTYGSFQRVFSFPVPVNAEGIEASYKDGVLTIRAPKAAKATAREIPVNGK